MAEDRFLGPRPPGVVTLSAVDGGGERDRAAARAWLALWAGTVGYLPSEYEQIMESLRFEDHEADPHDFYVWMALPPQNHRQRGREVRVHFMIP